MQNQENDNRIDYVEFNVTDINATRQFYGSAFGWRFTDYGPHYCEFDDGRLKGGFTDLEPPKPGGPLVILYAGDLDQALAKVEQAGGTIVKPITAFPGGRRFHFRDRDDYELAVWTKA